MSILSSHAGSGHSDKWYRRPWYIWPQTISLFLIGWLFVPWTGPQTQTPPKPQPPWARTQPPAKPATPTTRPQPNRDTTTCFCDNSGDTLAACTRLIDSGRLKSAEVYFTPARLYFDNVNFDPAITDLSSLIRQSPNMPDPSNER